MRYYKVLLLAVIFVFIFCGCSKQQGSNSTTEPLPTVNSNPIISTTVAPSDPWDVLSYQSIDCINKIKEINDGVNDVRTFTIQYNSDDCVLTGYLSIPEACLEDRIPYSCIIYARGGTMYMGSLTYDIIAETALSMNTIAISTEYRGTNSLATGKDEWGGRELNDFLKLIDFCEEFAFVDMERLYMHGVSRGGMTTYQAIRADDRIKKACVAAGVADLFISYEYRQDLRARYEAMIGGTPDELPEEYKKRSATYWADELNCPVLIFHSKEDPRVPYAEVEKLVAALEAAGKDYQFVSHDDDVHGLHPEDRPIFIEWFDFGPKKDI